MRETLKEETHKRVKKKKRGRGRRKGLLGRLTNKKRKQSRGGERNKKENILASQSTARGKRSQKGRTRGFRLKERKIGGNGVFTLSKKKTGEEEEKKKKAKMPKQERTLRGATPSEMTLQAKERQRRQGEEREKTAKWSGGAIAILLLS